MDPLVEAMAEQGWFVQKDFLPSEQWRALHLRLQDLSASGRMRPAAIGAGGHARVLPSVRGDLLTWMDPPHDPVEECLLARFACLKDAINRSLQLGLFDLECQYALYPPGARYARHLDQSRGGAERVVSVILYLNEGWAPADGGELRLYTESGQVSIPPIGGSVVGFLSHRFEHEVMVSRRPRCSIAGWFRRRARVVVR